MRNSTFSMVLLLIIGSEPRNLTKILQTENVNRHFQDEKHLTSWTVSGLSTFRRCISSRTHVPHPERNCFDLLAEWMGEVQLCISRTLFIGDRSSTLKNKTAMEEKRQQLGENMLLFVFSNSFNGFFPFRETFSSSSCEAKWDFIQFFRNEELLRLNIFLFTSHWKRKTPSCYLCMVDDVIHVSTFVSPCSEFLARFLKTLTLSHANFCSCVRLSISSNINQAFQSSDQYRERTLFVKILSAF